jgi:hypothetical protein
MKTWRYANTPLSQADYYDCRSFSGDLSLAAGKDETLYETDSTITHILGFLLSYASGLNFLQGARNENRFAVAATSLLRCCEFFSWSRLMFVDDCVRNFSASLRARVDSLMGCPKRRLLL